MSSGGTNPAAPIIGVPVNALLEKQRRSFPAVVGVLHCGFAALVSARCRLTRPTPSLPAWVGFSESISSAVVRTRCQTCAAVQVGFMLQTFATTPATIGHAIEVPLIVRVASLAGIRESWKSEGMFCPGAEMSTQVP